VRDTFIVRVALATAVALLLVPGAVAKDFRPGDLRFCNARRCVKIVDPKVVATLGPFYYSDGSPRRAQAPRLGARAYELRFPNGYVTGIVAGASLDRFLSYGVNLDRFHRGVWYRVPRRLTNGLTKLACSLRPLRVTKVALAKSR
jgi:hypothetical protein